MDPSNPKQLEIDPDLMAPSAPWITATLKLVQSDSDALVLQLGQAKLRTVGMLRDHASCISLNDAGSFIIPGTLMGIDPTYIPSLYKWAHLPIQQQPKRTKPMDESSLSQQFSGLTFAPQPPPAMASSAHHSPKTVYDVANEYFHGRKIVWPEPGFAFPLHELPPNNLHATKYNQQCVPLLKEEPYFPCVQLGNKLKPQIQRLNEKLRSEKPVAMMAPSGAGKSTLCLAYLAENEGDYFVGGGLVGSKDVVSITKRVRIEVDSNPERYGSNCSSAVDAEFAVGAEQRWLLAHHAVDALSWSRDLIRKRWIAERPDSFSSQLWLMSQLNPVGVLGRDVFNELALRLFNSIAPGGIPLQEWPRMTIFDEAQDGMKLCTTEGFGWFPSEKWSVEKGASGRRGSTRSGRRSFFDIFVSHRLTTGLVVAGTCVDVLRVQETLSSGSGTLKQEYNPVFYLDFPRLTAQDIRNKLMTWLNVTEEEVSESRACEWFDGRPRPLESLIVHAIKNPNTSLKSVVTFVVTMITTQDIPRSPCSLVSSLQLKRAVRQSSNDVTNFPEQAILTAVWKTYLGDTTQVVKGENAIPIMNLSLGYIKPEVTEWTDLVKGLTCAIEEPLMLEAIARTYFWTSEFLINSMKWVFVEPSAMGFQFEAVIPFAVAPYLFVAGTRLEQHPLFIEKSLPEAFTGEWTMGGAAKGVMAWRGQESTEDGSGQCQCVGQWLHQWLQYARVPGSNDLDWSRGCGRLPPAFLPSKAFGGDVVFLVFQGGKAMLVKVSSKLTKKLMDPAKALLRLDPAAAFDQNRGKDNQSTQARYKTSKQQYLDCLRFIPVLRILLAFPCTIVEDSLPTRSSPRSKEKVAANPPVRYHAVVAHGRQQSTFKEDVQIIIDGTRVKHVTQQKFRDFMFTLKDDPRWKDADENDDETKQ